MADSVPGGYFIGRPANKADDEQPQDAAAEPNKEPANTQIPGDYFIGTPENLRPEGTAAAATTEPGQPGGGELKRSKSFMECFSCLGGGQVAN